MQQKGFHRKLAAILSADVAGCSRLIQDDEAATVTTLAASKQAFFDLIKQHRGRVVDSPGDNLLAEFASVVDAVQCAVAVQKELQARTAELPENRRILFRIGVNLGDVIQDFFGDGLAEEIINALAKLPQVFVIARNSSFVYKEKAEELAQKALALDENLAGGHAFMGRIHPICRLTSCWPPYTVPQAAARRSERKRPRY